jgi:co-chaperonin GroES (HSP10)
MKKLSSQLILVKVDAPQEQDESGIYIQEEWKTLPPTGVVEAVADDVTFCKPGDNVFFDRYTAIDTPFGEDIRLCRADAIFAVFDA